MTYSNNGPCFGECGNGDRFRTQGVPKKSKELDYVHVLQVESHHHICHEPSCLVSMFRLAPAATTLSTLLEILRMKMLRRLRNMNFWNRRRLSTRKLT